MENKQHGAFYTCKRYRMYDWLTGRGWRPVNVVADMNNPNYKNWIYEATEEFNADVCLYFEKLKARV